jgi:hypothetical protein
MTSDVTLHSALSCMYKNLINRHFVLHSTLLRPFPAFQSFFDLPYPADVECLTSWQRRKHGE